jgi:ribosomal protein S18 acetylase RimI-like enzyme
MPGRHVLPRTTRNRTGQVTTVRSIGLTFNAEVAENEKRREVRRALLFSQRVLCELRFIFRIADGEEVGMKFDIATAQPDEFLDVAALDRIAWPNMNDTFIPDGEHIWRVWCDHATLLVARVTEREPFSETHEIAGALVMFPSQSGELFLHKIMVHPVCRGKGVGTSLMKTALAGTKVPVLLTVDPENSAAVALYEKFGFRPRERIDGYYRPHEDRLIMEYVPETAT